jgi:hypothetical protein
VSAVAKFSWNQKVAEYTAVSEFQVLKLMSGFSRHFWCLNQDTSPGVLFTLASRSVTVPNDLIETGKSQIFVCWRHHHVAVQTPPAAAGI